MRLEKNSSTSRIIDKPELSSVTTTALPVADGEFKRGGRFWMSFVAIMVSIFISALELTGVSTALPVITQDLHGSQFVWVGSAYVLSATAFLPLSGAMAEAFGRRPVMLTLLLIFALGSVLCGAATSMNFLIAGRAVQGLGGGGIASLTQIIVSDLVPLRQRGAYNGLIAVAWGFATCTGPVIGGALAQRGQWRWLFYMNIPICGFAAILVFIFLKLRTPGGTFREKFGKLDWCGNFLIIASTAAIVIGLTWGGIQFPWSSARVLVPLILGLVGLGIFFIYEAIVPKYAIVPFSLMSNRTGLSGYIQTFLAPVILLAAVYYLPVYYQACKGADPIASGVDVFGIAMPPVPIGIISGISIAVSKRYRPQLWFAWGLLMIASGLLSTVTAETSRTTSIGYQIILGSGIGILYTSTFFPVLAPLPISANAKALAFFMFLRYFAQVWGVTIGGTILQNGLQKRLPSDFVSTFPQGTAIAYSIIPSINGLEEPFRTQVQDAFGNSLQTLWRVLIALSGFGFLVSLAMKHLPLHTSVDRDWGLQEEIDTRQREKIAPLSWSDTTEEYQLRNIA